MKVSRTTGKRIRKWKVEVPLGIGQGVGFQLGLKLGEKVVAA